jgi:cell division septation protein DedD
MNNQDDSDDFLNDDLFDEPVKKHSVGTLIVTCLAVVGLIGASWYIYDSYKEKNDNEMLLITAEQEEIKIQPLDPGGMVVENMDKSVYDSIEKKIDHSETKVEVLLQPSEEPIDKKEELVEVIPTNEAQKTVQIIEKKTNKAAADIETSTEEKWTKEEEYIKPVATKSVAKPKFASKNERFYKIQLASFKSSSDAEKEWKNLSRKHSSLLKGYKHYVVSKDIAGKGLFYRLQVGPFKNADEARNACTQFKDAGVNCLIVKP